MTESRKASDVLLDLESKISILLDIVRSQDLNIKILSNKLNDLLLKMDKTQIEVPKATIESVSKNAPNMNFIQNIPLDPEKNIVISAETSIPMENFPQGFRRTSRPETYALASENNKLPLQATKQAIIQQQLPPHMPVVNKVQEVDEIQFIERSQNQIPVKQRVVDKNGKSIFLADVEINDLTANKTLFRTRTNGTGKWMASLEVGKYRVIIRKRESLSKEKIETIQDITIDGSSSPLELPMLIIK